MGPSDASVPADPSPKRRRRYEEAVDQIRGWLTDARRYQRSVDGGAQPRRDLRLEALTRALTGELPFLVLADQARDVRNAVEFAEDEGVRVIIVSGRDAWKEADFLAEKDIPVLLRATQNVPVGDDDPYHTTFSAAVRLHEAGVRFAMTGWASAGPNPPSRTLPYEAANAVPFGLPEAEALRAITRYPAEILGLGDELGTIEVGKIGNLIVTDGDSVTDSYAGAPRIHRWNSVEYDEQAPGSVREVPGETVAAFWPVVRRSLPGRLGRRSRLPRAGHR